MAELQGSLKAFGVTDILQLIQMQNKTGVLTIRNATGDEAVHIFFYRGRIIDADAEPRHLEDRLGYVLVRTGQITPQQLEEALQIQKKTLRKLGLVLKDIGALDEAALRRALEIQIMQTIFRTFYWQDGTYAFENRDDILYDPESHVELSPSDILMQGMQILDEMPIIRKKIPDMQMIFRRRIPIEMVKVTETPEDELILPFAATETREAAGAEEEMVEIEIVSMTPDEFAVFQKIDGQRTVQEIVETTPQPEFNVLQTLVRFYDAGWIEPIRRTGERPIVEIEEPGIAVLPHPARWAQYIQATVAVLALLVFVFAWGSPLRPAVPAMQPPAADIRLQTAVQHTQTFVLGHYLLNETWPESLRNIAYDPVIAHFMKDARERWMHLVRKGDQIWILTPSGQPVVQLDPPRMTRSPFMDPTEGLRIILTPSEETSHGP